MYVSREREPRMGVSCEELNFWETSEAVSERILE
jgi:hypothetical protein